MDKSKYITTGEFARIMNTTKNTLFHYDQIGLFCPDVIDTNGYRYYGFSQIDTFEVIQLLQELDIPLAEMKQYLNGNTREELLALYDRELEALDEKLKQLAIRKKSLQELKRNTLEFQNIDIDRIYVEERPSYYYLFVHTASEDEKDYSKSVSSLVDDYRNYIPQPAHTICYLQYKKDLNMGYYDNYHDIILKVSRKPVRKKEISRSAAKPFQKASAGKYLIAYHKGHWNTIGKGYERILAYAREHQLQLDETFYETYVVDRLSVKNPEEFVSEIAVRILD